MRKLANHAIVKYVNEGGFQPRRQLVCRCGWKTPIHYNRGYIEQLYKEHKANAQEQPVDQKAPS